MFHDYWLQQPKYTQVARRQDGDRFYCIYDVEFIPVRKMAATNARAALQEAKDMGYVAPVVAALKAAA